MSDTAKKTAEKLADIMIKHLSKLTPEEQKRSIEAGHAVLKKKPKAAAAPSGSYPTSSSPAGILRSPLAARGR